MGEVPLFSPHNLASASERRGINMKGFKDFPYKPRPESGFDFLVCQIRWTAAQQKHILDVCRGLLPRQGETRCGAQYQGTEGRDMRAVRR